MYQITEVSDDGQPCAQKNQGQVCVTVWGHCKGQRAHQLQRMEGKTDNPHVVPESVKNFLWDEILKHFTLPEGVEPTNVKCWTLTRMATQF
jgi:hypothetical protein